MKILFHGKKEDFSEVLAVWLVKYAKQEGSMEQCRERNISEEMAKELSAILRGGEAAELLSLLKLMVNNRIQFENMIAFSARYKSAVGKATEQDVQEALNLIGIMEVHTS